MQARSENTRLWEVDAVRGLAVVAMVVSNFLFDLYFFVGLPVSPQGKAGWLARGTAGTFLVLVGVSLVLSHGRRPAAPLFRLLRRSAGLVGLGMLVSLATWFAAGDQLVIFGILHCIGVSILVARPLVTRPWTATAIGAALLAAGPLVGRLHPATPLLIPLGMAPADFASVDYVPLIPWSGLVLLGIGLGNLLYQRGRRRYRLPDWSDRRLLRGLVVLGRHSLIIYFVHQPVLLALLWCWLRLAA